MSDSTAKQITDKLYAEHGTPVRDKPFRVWWVPQIPLRSGEKPFYVEVPDFKTAAILEGVLAAYDEYQYDNKIKPDYANAGGIERWDEAEGDWVSIDESEYDEWEDK